MFKFTYVLLTQGVDELWQDLVGHDGLSKLIRVVGKSTKGQGSRLLDTWDVIQQEWSQEGHNTCALKSLDVLGSLSQLSDSLNESDSSFLVSFEWG
jgi:hypothetical protein